MAHSQERNNGMVAYSETGRIRLHPFSPKQKKSTVGKKNTHYTLLHEMSPQTATSPELFL